VNLFILFAVLVVVVIVVVLGVLGKLLLRAGGKVMRLFNWGLKTTGRAE
jgi:hypothetical protein